jgi:hypothetical protein
MVLLLKSACNIVDPYSRLLIIGFVLLILSSVFSIYATSPIVAQTPETSSSPQATGLPTIQITTPQDGQQVPPGELSIQGISSDDEQTDCQVYADVNDITPMRNVTAAEDSEEDNDFSKWTFKYTQDYQLIKQGENELTAKISCSDNGDFDLNPFPTTGAQTTSSNSPLSEWHTVNVTAVQGAAAVPSSSPSLSDTEEIDETGNDDDDEESGGESSDEGGSNDDSTDDGSDGLFD